MKRKRVTWRIGAVAGVAVLVGGLIIVGTGPAWRGDRYHTLDMANMTTDLTGPILAGISAAAVQELWRGSEIYRPTQRAWAAVARAEAAIAAWSCAGLGLLAALMMCATLLIPNGGPLPVWCLTEGFGLLIFAVALGGCVGALIRSRMGVALAVVAFFLAGLLCAVGVFPNIFRSNGTTGLYSGYAPSPRYLLSKSAVLGGVALALLAITPTLDLIARRARGARIAVATIGCLVMLGAGLIWWDVRNAPVAASDETASVCTDTRPMLCLAPSAARYRDQVQQASAPMAKKLTDFGLALPGRYDQQFGFYRPPVEHGSFWFGTDSRGAPQMSNYDVADWLATPRTCPQMYGSAASADRLLAAKDTVRYGWLLKSADAMPTDKVRTAWNVLITCDGKISP